MIVFHHSDLDGRCSAAIVYLKYPKAKFIEVDYGSEIDFDQIKLGEEVVIVDFSFGESDGYWQKLFARTENIVWIDHHETAIKTAMAQSLKDGNWPLLKGIRTEERCGAWLTWEYFFDKEVPMAVRLVDRWDRFVHNGNKQVLNFVAGMEITDTNPEAPAWQILLEQKIGYISFLKTICEQGAPVLAYKKIEAVRQLKQLAYEMRWEGHDCIVLNTATQGSSMLLEYLEKHYDVCITWQFGPKHFTVHLYSKDVKVNEIAEKHGGGGHPGAAGFVCDKLPF